MELQKRQKTDFWRKLESSMFLRSQPEKMMGFFMGILWMGKINVIIS